MRLDVVPKPGEGHPANHLWYMGGSVAVCTEELMVPAHPKGIVMLGSMGCGVKGIWKKKEEEGKLSSN